MCRKFKKKYRIFLNELIINPLHVLHNIYMKESNYLIEYYENMFSVILSDKRVFIDNVHYKEIITYVHNMRCIMKRLNKKADIIYNFYDTLFYHDSTYDDVITNFYLGNVPKEVVLNMKMFKPINRTTVQFVVS
jgi:hypothetical protein